MDKNYSKEINDIIASTKYPWGANVKMSAHYREDTGNVMHCSAVYKELTFEVNAAFKDIERMLAATPFPVLMNQACKDMYFRLQDEICNKVLGRQS